MLYIKLTILLTAAYLFGAIPFGYLAAKLFRKIDIRRYGSGNIGATNVVRVCGKKLGYPVFVLDVLKGVIPVFTASVLFKETSGVFYNFSLILAASASVAGHNWTCFLGFRGGKGVATTAGSLAALSAVLFFLRMPLFAAIIIWLAVFFIFRVVSLGSVTAAVTFALFCVFSIQVPLEFKILACFLALFILFRHKNNLPEIIRILVKKKGTAPDSRHQIN